MGNFEGGNKHDIVKDQEQESITPENKKKLEKSEIKAKRIKEYADKIHENESIEADLEIKLQLEGKENFINVIENKEEFKILYKKIGDLLKTNGKNISKEEINQIKKEGPKNLKEELILLYEKNPQKFKDMYTILDGINKNGLQNAFIDNKQIDFNNIVKESKNKLENEFKNVPHIPNSEKKIMDIVEKYYN